MIDDFDPIAFVTGVSRGIGRSIAEKLLASNIPVIGTAHKSPFSAELENESHFEGVRVDLSTEKSFRESLKKIFQGESPPNVIVNNAGISEEASFALGDEEWEDNWERTIQTNLKTPALICKWALNRWTKTPSIPGIIINIASRAAYRGDTADFASYAASKGGLAAFTKSIARSYGKRRITAYTIAPGFVDTDMAEQVKEVYGEGYLTDDLALDELTSPEEVAQLVLFLAQGKGRHMTGTTFHVNAGSYMV